MNQTWNNDQQALWDLALDYQDQRHFATALVLLRRLRSQTPEDNSTDLAYARLLIHVGLMDEAYSILRETTCQKHKGSFTYLSVWVRFFQKKGDVENEELWSRRIIEEIPDKTYGYIYLGCCLGQQGRLAEAETVFRQGSVLEGDPDEAMYNLAMILRCTMRLEEAREVLEEILKQYPTEERARHALVDVNLAIDYQNSTQP